MTGRLCRNPLLHFFPYSNFSVDVTAMSKCANSHFHLFPVYTASLEIYFLLWFHIEKNWCAQKRHDAEIRRSVPHIRFVSFLVWQPCRCITQNALWDNLLLPSKHLQLLHFYICRSVHVKAMYMQLPANDWEPWRDKSMTCPVNYGTPLMSSLGSARTSVRIRLSQGCISA